MNAHFDDTPACSTDSDSCAPQVAEQGRSVLSADDGARDWRNYENHFDDEFDDDDEVRL